ncbi:MAG: PAS domain-containing protein, partial [Rubrivivax sp.]
MTFDERDLPPGALLDVRRVRRQVTALAARTLVVYSAVLAAVLAAASLLELALLPGGWALNRLSMGALLAAGGLLSWWILRRGHPGLAAYSMLLVFIVALGLHAWSIGLGVHSVALSGATLLIAGAGLLVGWSAAVGVFALSAAAIGVLAAAEVAGWIPGRSAIAVMPLSNRVIGLGLLALGGLVGALLLQRLMNRVFVHALTEQQRLAQLLMIGNDWAFEMDAKGRITYISPSFEIHTGRTIEEFSKTAEDGGPRVQPSAHWDDAKQAMREHRPYRDRVVTFECQDGTLLHVRGNADPIFDEQGRLLGYRGASRNVTAEVKAQQKQSRTQALLDRLVQTSPDALCVARRDGAILLANPRFLALAGLPE